LLLNGLSCNEVRLSWAPSTDPSNPNQQSSGFNGYNIYRNGYFWARVSAPGATDGTVGANASYRYRVSSVDNAGNESAQSAELSVTTPACAAPGPRDLKISVSSGKAALQWSGIPGVLYQLERASGPSGPWSPVDAP